MSQVDSLRNRIQECDKNRPFIFISYKRSDAENVYPKVVELQEKGVNVWIDKEMKSSVGRDWQSPAFQALNNVNCKVILFFVSKKSLVSPPVLAELLYSQEDKVKFRHKEKPLPILSFDLDNLIGMYGSISKYVQDNDELSRNTLNKENLRAMFPDINFSKYAHIYDGIDNEFDLAYHILNAANLRDGKVILAAGIQEIIATLNQDYSEVFMKKTFVEQEYFNVSFDIGGKIRQEVVVKGTKLTEPEVPTQKEFNFIGWVYSTSDGETVWDFDKDIIVRDIELLAKWEKTDSPSQKKLSSNTTLKEFSELCEYRDFCLELRELRQKGRKEYGARMYFDYLMAALLRGCDEDCKKTSKMKSSKNGEEKEIEEILNRARWNYCTYAVSEKLNLDDPNPKCGASQFTWSSRARQAVGLKGSNKLGENSEVFKKLDENTTLGQIEKYFTNATEVAFSTKDNASVLKFLNAILQIDVEKILASIGV